MPYPLTHYAVGFVLVATLVAFWPSYFGQFGEAPPAFHVHGITATLWLLLTGFQSWAVHDGRRALHRSTGLLSFVLFPVLTGSLVMIADVSAAGFVAGDPADLQLGPVFGWATAVALVAYLWLFSQALRYRHRVQMHAGYMLATIFFLWEPAASRLLVGFFPPMAVGGPADLHKIPHAIALGSAMALPLAAYLYLRRDRGRTPLMVAMVFLALQIAGIYTVAETGWWRTAFAIYGELPGAVTVGTGFVLGAFATWWGWARPNRREAPARPTPSEAPV